MDSIMNACEKNEQTLMDSAPHLITSINEEGQIVDCNNKILEFLRYDRSDVIGHSILEFIHPKCHKKASDLLDPEFRSHFLNRENFKMIRKDGSEISVLVNPTNIKRINKNNSSRVWVIEDASEQVVMDGHLLGDGGYSSTSTSISTSSRTGTSAEVYLDVLGYDIKKLTQSIIAYSELLLMKPDLSEQYKKYFETTLEYSRIISDLISNVRKLAYIKQNNIELKEIDVLKALAQATDRVQKKHSHRILQINQSISEGEIIVSSIDLLKYAFYNLLNNAIKFDGHDPVVLDIAHTLLEDQAYWKIEFKDHGSGVPDNMKTRIFQDYEIGNEIVHGSGLGLAVVKEVIAKSQGQIWVEDRITGDHTKGSNFVILLPRYGANL